MGIGQTFSNSFVTDQIERTWKARFSGSGQLQGSDGGSSPSAHVERETPKRLSDDEAAQLVQAYRSGATVNQLAEHWGIHRTTVLEHLKRQDVPRRQSKIEDERLPDLIAAYEAGVTLAGLGREYEVRPETVRNTLVRAGVQIRGGVPRS